MSSHELTFKVFRFKKVVKNIFSARLGLHDAGQKIREHNHNPPLSISFVHKSPNQEANVPFNPNPPSVDLFLALPKQQKANGPQIYSLYVPGASPFSESMDMAWKKELTQIQAELDEINAMVGLEGRAEGRAEVDSQTEKRHEVVKADVFQETKKEVAIIRGLCDDLLEQQEKATQKHKILCQFSDEKVEELKKLVQLVLRETEKESDV